MEKVIFCLKHLKQIHPILKYLFSLFLSPKGMDSCLVERGRTCLHPYLKFLYYTILLLCLFYFQIIVNLFPLKGLLGNSHAINILGEIMQRGKKLSSGDNG